MAEDPNVRRADAMVEGAPAVSVAAAVDRFLDNRIEPQAFGATRSTPTLNYLLMSTGGQYGAFGAGFLAGWSQSETDPRPDFDIVTGASAGGILAPVAAAGPEFDEKLNLITGKGGADLIRERGPLGALFSNSLVDISPLEALIRDQVDTELLQALVDRREAGQTAFVGAVNLDTGAFEVIDLSAIAAEAPKSEAEPCVEEAILATSAIPAAFPPRFINGVPYSDAGLRDHVFIDQVREGVANARSRGQRIRLNAYIIINGDLDLEATSVKNSLTGIAQRSAQIVSDAGLRKSILEVLRLDQETNWSLRAITARDVVFPQGCDTSTLFEACVTQALYDAGFEMGSAKKIPWLSARELRALAQE
ncbi:MAG: patatin-like phospholipase family protein [Pseudomonadota bacterium]